MMEVVCDSNPRENYNKVVLCKRMWIKVEKEEGEEEQELEEGNLTSHTTTTPIQNTKSLAAEESTSAFLEEWRRRQEAEKERIRMLDHTPLPPRRPPKKPNLQQNYQNIVIGGRLPMGKISGQRPKPAVPPKPVFKKIATAESISRVGQGNSFLPQGKWKSLENIISPSPPSIRKLSESSSDRGLEENSHGPECVHSQQGARGRAHGGSEQTEQVKSTGNRGKVGEFWRKLEQEQQNSDSQLKQAWSSAPRQDPAKSRDAGGVPTDCEVVKSEQTSVGMPITVKSSDTGGLPTDCEVVVKSERLSAGRHESSESSICAMEGRKQSTERGAGKLARSAHSHSCENLIQSFSNADGKANLEVFDPSKPNKLERKQSAELEIMKLRKGELVARISEKLGILREDRETVQREVTENEVKGEKIVIDLGDLAKLQEIDRLRRHMQEVECMTSLRVCLASRLARTQVATGGQDKELIEKKREKIKSQINEAQSLQEVINKRELNLIAMLTRYLGIGSAQAFQHYLRIKVELMTELRELEDRLKMAEEQLAALLLT